ncbi:MAG TPA: hypothetical protein VK590_02435 [Saprospiraceae bacterium]|nr:hypothetical protein [Saprospiraceae bacterium]
MKKRRIGNSYIICGLGLYFTKYTNRVFMVLILSISMNNIYAQQAKSVASVSIKATATVIEVQEIEMITMQDMVLDQANIENGFIYISPKRDPEAGVMLVKGRPNSKVRINYINNLNLHNAVGEGKLEFHYEVTGYPSNNQRASQVLDSADPIIQFNEEGKYYLWIGGRVNVKDANPGNYLGEFTFQIEYI